MCVVCHSQKFIEITFSLICQSPKVRKYAYDWSVDQNLMFFGADEDLLRPHDLASIINFGTEDITGAILVTFMYAL